MRIVYHFNHVKQIFVMFWGWNERQQSSFRNCSFYIKNVLQFNYEFKLWAPATLMNDPTKLFKIVEKPLMEIASRYYNHSYFLANNNFCYNERTKFWYHWWYKNSRLRSWRVYLKVIKCFHEKKNRWY